MQFLHADNEDCDQTARMRRQIWLSVGREYQIVRLLKLQLISNSNAVWYKQWLLFGVFYFVHIGEPLRYTNWVSGRKNNFASHYTEDCVAFIPYKQGQWDDIPCGTSGIFGDRGETHPYMCEYSKQTFL